MLSGYRIMWMMVMFDLPVVTKRQRKIANGFRKGLTDLGFTMTQYSVYTRFCSSQNQQSSLVSAVRIRLPPQGRVNILFFTDKQFERILSYVGQVAVPGKTPPSQLNLF